MRETSPFKRVSCGHVFGQSAFSAGCRQGGARRGLGWLVVALSVADGVGHGADDALVVGGGHAGAGGGGFGCVPGGEPGRTALLPDEGRKFYVVAGSNYDGYVVAGVVVSSEDEGEYFDASPLWSGSA
jgi:hypothetical protein